MKGCLGVCVTVDREEVRRFGSHDEPFLPINMKESPSGTALVVAPKKSEPPLGSVRASSGIFVP